MIDSTLLFKGTTAFSPWFPRKADMLRVTAECVALSGATMTIKLYTKSREETGDGEPVDTGTTLSLDTPGRKTEEWKTVVSQEGVEELLRFQFVVTGTDDNDWILYRLLTPVWFDAVKG